MPDNIRNDLKTIDWSGFFACTNINRSWDIIESNLLAVFDKHAPIIQKRVKGSQSPWLSTDIKDVMNDRDKMLRRARKSKCEHDWTSYRHLRNQCTNKVKKAKAAHLVKTLKTQETFSNKISRKSTIIIVCKRRTTKQNFIRKK